MLTPQEVSSHAFTKGFMGGYNMAMVDEFLDELTDDYTALYKENAALKAKMKVLVEKVEDYRATEDSMRATLLTAQKMADSIVREAEARRDNLLAQAESDARERIAQIQRDVEAAEERLRQGQRELARFIAAIQKVCGQELKFLEELPQLPVDISVPVDVPAAAPVQEVREPAAASSAEEPSPAPAAPEELPVPATATAEIPPEEAPAAVEPPYPEGDPFAREEAESLEATRRIKFDKLDDLKFGPNYTSGT
ncbi:DivIVA domain-containing protein [uncultured Oscillibacter sp.]|jgi:cell division initiation protein|uniref:DivIVA domain-containing protein n=1 Tax=uncultured Oscillibacter sp. TaxID=876091 RepID=UPI0025F7C456|nr:DivIVA domain-containing protein [uncultured Oscillibacter sp.]